MLKIIKTDFLSLLFAILLAPLIFLKINTYQVNSISSNTRIYSERYFPYVKSNAIFMKQCNTQDKNGSLLILPGYSFGQDLIFTDRLEFISLFNEILYGQKHQTPQQRSIYQNQEMLFTSKKILLETQFIEDTKLHSIQSNVSGKITYLGSKNNLIYGTTEDFGIFVQDLNQTLMASNILQNLSYDFMQHSNLTNLYSQKAIFVDNFFYSSIFVSNYTHFGVYTSKININNSIVWQNMEALPISKLNYTKQDSIIRQIKSSVNISFKLLSELISDISLLKLQHGEQNFIIVQNNFVGIKTKNFIHIMSQQNGETLASFSISPGIILFQNKLIGGFDVSFLSDQNIVQDQKNLLKFDCFKLNYQGDNLQNLKIKKIYQIQISKENQILTQTSYNDLTDFEALIDPILQPLIYEFGNSVYSLFLTRDGIIYCLDFDSGKLKWKTKIENINLQANSIHISILDISIQQKLICLTIDYLVNLLDFETGKLISYWQTPEVLTMYSSKDILYQENKVLSSFQIIATQLNEKINISSIFVLRNGLMDVLQVSVKNVSLMEFWERTSLFILLALIICLCIRMKNEQDKIE